MDDYLDTFDPFAPASWEEEDEDAWDSPTEEEETVEKEETKVKPEPQQAERKEKEMPEKTFPELEAVAVLGHGQFTQHKRAAAQASFEARQQREREEAADAYRQKFLGDLTKELKKTKDGEQAQYLVARKQQDFEEFMSGVDEELEAERMRFMQEVARRFN